MNYALDGFFVCSGKRVDKTMRDIEVLFVQQLWLQQCVM